MINPKSLLTELQALQKKLEADLRAQVQDLPELYSRLHTDYQAGFASGRTADTFSVWSGHEVTQAAVSWLLSCVFVRFCEDNGLLRAPLLTGPDEAARRRAHDAYEQFIQGHPTLHQRHWLEHCFDQMAVLPALKGLFDRAHVPLFGLPLSFEAARDLLAFWQRIDPDSGQLRHDFRDPALNTRFLGDLYQDLSEAARKRFALLQTPEFVEEFILDRTLEPAIDTFGLKGIRLIDPTCGSGHFLLGAFHRVLGHWQRTAPGLDAREHVKEALSGVYGVDLNPFAVAIARFRLLVAALIASGVRTLKEAPGWTFNLTVGDSLLHGPRFGQGELPLEQTGIAAEYAHVYQAEDFEEIHRILGQRYHAVVGNPPYITASDSALNQLYRDRYRSCHRKFSLGVPFTERFFQLALPGDADQAAGFVGLITADSFMKREFGKKLIEEFLPRQDLTHLIHTSGAYIPGHGTPTVILFGRNRAPVQDQVRAVLGIRGEPATPEDPAQGLVWSSIVALTDRAGSSNDWISVADMQRSRLSVHPWSLQGGGAPDVLAQIESATSAKLSGVATEVGFGAILGEDDAFVLSPARADFRRAATVSILKSIDGELVRDWHVSPSASVLFPYDKNMALVPESSFRGRLWNLRCLLECRNDFSGKTYRDAGRAYWSYHQIPVSRCLIPLSICFGEVATHNHFVLDRGGKVFKQTAPVIKLPADASVDDHLGLLGLLNSSTACFWLKQVCHNKGSTVDAHGARQTTVEFENFYQLASTRLQQFPLPTSRPLALSTQLDHLARQRTATLPAALIAQFPLTRTELDHARDRAASLLAQMIALQEELDWWCYDAYGLHDQALCFPTQPPEIQLGQRAFEIVLGRQMAAGEVETTWFSRHGSTPITELPRHWPADYAALVQERIDLIESSAWIALIERPEYKRRWNQPSWAELEIQALRSWLLDRLESPRYWPEASLRRIADLVGSAEKDADFLQVAELYTAQAGFSVSALLRELLAGETVPALKVQRYKESGLRKRADWEHTWELQRQEDALDAQVARELPREESESDADWAARLKPIQDRLKAEQIGKLAAPPKYISADFLSSTLWRLRGGLDVPKERFFSVPDPLNPTDALYGWAGWNPAQRVQALAAACTEAEERHGVGPVHLVPLLAALHEQLPWVLQWHNDIDPETDVRLGDFFRSWLGDQLNRHGWTLNTLAQWRPVAATRGRKRK